MRNVKSPTKRDFTNASLTDLHPKASRVRALRGVGECLHRVAAPRTNRPPTEQDEHVGASGLLSRVVARLRGH
jgi:hypothetical protein